MGKKEFTRVQPKSFENTWFPFPRLRNGTLSIRPGLDEKVLIKGVYRLD